MGGMRSELIHNCNEKYLKGNTPLQATNAKMLYII